MLDKAAFRQYNNYLEVEDIIKDNESYYKAIAQNENVLRSHLLENWVKLEQLEASTGLTPRFIRNKIRDASLVGLLWEKQWYILTESVEDAGYDI